MGGLLKTAATLALELAVDLLRDKLKERKEATHTPKGWGQQPIRLRPCANALCAACIYAPSPTRCGACGYPQ